MNIKSGEIIFIKCVKDGIPNRDPLNDSNARRIFGEDDGRISLSDVSIKRDVRDYVTAKYPDGGSDRNKYIYVREERTEDGKLLGRASLADKIKERSGNTNAKMQSVLTSTAFDVRTFGIVYSVRKESFKITGPVQFGWAHSMHQLKHNMFKVLLLCHQMILRTCLMEQMKVPSRVQFGQLTHFLLLFLLCQES